MKKDKVERLHSRERQTQYPPRWPFIPSYPNKAPMMHHSHVTGHQARKAERDFCLGSIMEVSVPTRIKTCFVRVTAELAAILAAQVKIWWG